jgi:hypothetical protein
MRRFFVFVFVSVPLLSGQDFENFRIEVTGSAWRTQVEGELQSGVLPVDLRSDLNLPDTYNFLGRLVLKPGRRHRIIIDGGPFESSGTNQLSRSIVFNGRTYTIRDAIESTASLTSIYGGYQFDVISRNQGHLGFSVGGVYLNAEGSIRSATTGGSATRAYDLGLPLAGAEFRVFVIPGSRLLNINGEVRGMQFGGYGHYVRAMPAAGLSLGRITFQAGYAILDADIHENRPVGDRTGVAPRFTGPFFGIQLRDR